MFRDRYNTCRFCKSPMSTDLLKYGTRHYAHYACYLDAGKKLSALRAWQVGKFPYFLLKERGLLAEAEAITKKANWRPTQGYQPQGPDLSHSPPSGGSSIKRPS